MIRCGSSRQQPEDSKGMQSLGGRRVHVRDWFLL